MSARQTTRRRAGARVSRRVLRWPKRNYFAELAPRARETHPVDDLMESDPDLRQISRRVRRLLARLQVGETSHALLDYEAERVYLDGARIEVAFNLGFESGLINGRADGLRRSARRSLDETETKLVTDLRAALEAHRAAPNRAQLLLQELAWALAAGESTRTRLRGGLRSGR
jgi:hypothetical protein